MICQRTFIIFLKNWLAILKKVSCLDPNNNLKMIIELFNVKCNLIQTQTKKLRRYVCLERLVSKTHLILLVINLE